MDRSPKICGISRSLYPVRRRATDGRSCRKSRRDVSRLNIVATYNLIFNGSLLVEEGLGYAVCFDKIINTTGDSRLCFRPLRPEIAVAPCIVWKRYPVFSKAAEKFVQQLQKLLEIL